jgi:hypothetical protein
MALNVSPEALFDNMREKAEVHSMKTNVTVMRVLLNLSYGKYRRSNVYLSDPPPQAAAWRIGDLVKHSENVTVYQFCAIKATRFTVCMVLG